MGVKDILYRLDVLLDVRRIAYLGVKLLDVLRGPALLIAKTAHLLALRVEDDDRGEAIHAELLDELRVLLGGLRRQKRLFHRRVHHQEDVLLRRGLLEFVCREHLLVEPLAPAAPVASGEIDDYVLVLVRRFLEGSVVVVEPSLGRRSLRVDGQRKKRGQRCNHRFFHFSPFPNCAFAATPSSSAAWSRARSSAASAPRKSSSRLM